MVRNQLYEAWPTTFLARVTMDWRRSWVLKDIAPEEAGHSHIRYHGLRAPRNEGAQSGTGLLKGLCARGREPARRCR